MDENKWRVHLRFQGVAFSHQAFITAKDDMLYLHVYQWNKEITLTGIKSKVTAVKLLADPARAMKWLQEPCGMLGYDRLTIHLPGEAPDINASVL